MPRFFTTEYISRTFVVIATSTRLEPGLSCSAGGFLVSTVSPMETIDIAGWVPEDGSRPLVAV